MAVPPPRHTPRMVRPPYTLHNLRTTPYILHPTLDRGGGVSVEAAIIWLSDVRSSPPRVGVGVLILPTLPEGGQCTCSSAYGIRPWVSMLASSTSHSPAQGEQELSHEIGSSPLMREKSRKEFEHDHETGSRCSPHQLATALHRAERNTLRKGPGVRLGLRVEGLGVRG